MSHNINLRNYKYPLFKAKKYFEFLWPRIYKQTLEKIHVVHLSATVAYSGGGVLWDIKPLGQKVYLFGQSSIWECCLFKIKVLFLILTNYLFSSCGNNSNITVLRTNFQTGGGFPNNVLLCQFLLVKRLYLKGWLNSIHRTHTSGPVP